MTIPTNIIAAAQVAQHNWGVWASVSLAQFGIESAWGRAMPKDSNNPFGIKALPGHPSVSAMTSEFLHGRYVRMAQPFAKFDNFDEAFNEHAKLLATHPAVYGECMKHAYRSANPSAEAFARGLIHYATDPHYIATILGVMRSMNLYQYDTLPKSIDIV